MKVIKKGTGQKGWSTEVKCTGDGNHGGGCGATLLVEQPDLYITRSHHYDGSSESYVTFTCPECDVETDLPEGKAYNAIALGLPTRGEWLKQKA